MSGPALWAPCERCGMPFALPRHVHHTCEEERGDRVPDPATQADIDEAMAALDVATLELSGGRINALKTALRAGIVTLVDLTRRAEMHGGKWTVDLGEQASLLRLLETMKRAYGGEGDERDDV